MAADADAASDGRWLAHLTTGRSLARTLDFSAVHPHVFGAPLATSTPLQVGTFNGDVARGASCNCHSITLVPHCNGTHTESVAHLTRERLLLGEIVPLQPLPALLLSIAPVGAEDTAETADPPPQPGDRLLTARGIAAAWEPHRAQRPAARVLVLRTGDALDARGEAPYLSLEALQLVVARGIEHLVVELPSVDRGEDQGRLAGHRLFFGLPAGSTRLADAQRPHATITELACVPAECVDGPCAVQLQLAPWSGDAVPSRPVLFALAAP
jgi:kynurenine formamidase